MSTQLIHDGLIAAGRTAAQSFKDLKVAEAEIAEAHGQPYEATRNKLGNMVVNAFKEDFEFSPFQGAESQFIFPDLGTRIEIVFSKVPDRKHKAIDEVNALLTRAETRVKELKSRRNAVIAKLAIKGEIELVPQPPTLRFKQIAQS